MTNLLKFPTTIRRPPDNDHWALIRENLTLSAKLKSHERMIRYFAEGIHEYANRSGDSYLAEEARTFLRSLELDHGPQA